MRDQRIWGTVVFPNTQFVLFGGAQGLLGGFQTLEEARREFLRFNGARGVALYQWSDCLHWVEVPID